jgi:hypothetical protein
MERNGRRLQLWQNAKKSSIIATDDLPVQTSVMAYSPARAPRIALLLARERANDEPTVEDELPMMVDELKSGVYEIELACTEEELLMELGLLS